MLHTVSIHTLEAAFTDENYPKLFAGQETHDAALRFTKRLARYLHDPKLIKEAAASGFPSDYTGNTLTELDRMIKGAFEKNLDQASPNKPGKAPPQKEQMLAVLEASNIRFFKDTNGRALISEATKDGGAINHPVRSSAAKRLLIRLVYESTGKAPTGQALTETLDLFEAIALSGDITDPVFTRIGGHDGRIVVDLATNDRCLVIIGPDGWELSYGSTPRFLSPPGMRALPLPRRGKALRKLQKLLNLSETAYALVLAFLLNCLRPTGPYFCLLVEGEQGSGKSFLCKLLKLIIDPRRVEKIRLPDSERDLAVLANSYYLLVFDNASGMKGDMSDALCTIATGGGIGIRKLFTDEELHEIDVTRPFIINGISGLVTRPDLMERAIHLVLSSMPSDGRKTERQMLAEFDTMLPEILGELYDLVACALRNEASVQAPTNIRMADAAHFLQAAEPGTDLEPGTFLKVLTSAQTELMVEQVSNHPIVVRLRTILAKGPFEGTMGELHQVLVGSDLIRVQNLPRTPAHLSRELERQKPAMQKAGILISDRRTRKGKEIRVWLEGVEAPIDDEAPTY
jgi:energy-coupling factor transporter ATP-binding protein EcfA2